jgi:glycosyltransferase involved in cell wall biosynthesis
MRFHVVGLPHTQTHKSHTACAFTMKVLKFCRMMKSLGHTVYHYGAEGSDVACDEHVQIISRQEQEGYFGRHDPNALYNADWSGNAPYWKLTNDRAAAEINRRKQPGDFACMAFGSLQQPLAAQISPDVMVVETGIGYNGTFAQYRVFESYSHMHKIWGTQGGYDPDGKLYDVVIPNYFDPQDFLFSATKTDYYLYLGRLVKRKGVHIAVETCKRIGAKLKIAGQGCVQVEKFPGGQRLRCADGEVYEGDIEYVGCAIGERRATLFRDAIATFVPTTYIEPFGGVAVETQFAGTPAITTDFGAFPETVEHGKTGFRCRTLDQFVWAAKHVRTLDPTYIRDRAVAAYSMDAVKWRYETYFKQLHDLWADGWYTVHPAPDDRWLRGY